ncbi:hypothetical protein FOA52_012255 [Chlamydomonas sp. UWO 241]|nr:hypothetical protein FOA52_012255 [Chlamydomonas sp. UWO 241]
MGDVLVLLQRLTTELASVKQKLGVPCSAAPSCNGAHMHAPPRPPHASSEQLSGAAAAAHASPSPHGTSWSQSASVAVAASVSASAADVRSPACFSDLVSMLQEERLRGREQREAEEGSVCNIGGGGGLSGARRTPSGCPPRPPMRHAAPEQASLHLPAHEQASHHLPAHGHDHEAPAAHHAPLHELSSEPPPPAAARASGARAVARASPTTQAPAPPTTQPLHPALDDASVAESSHGQSR